MSLIDALARRSAVAAYTSYCRVEDIIETVEEELDELWKKMRPAAFAAADLGKAGRYQLEYQCTLEGAADLTDQDIEDALPEELANIRRLNGGRLIVIRKFSPANTFLINIHFSHERDQILSELKVKHADRRRREKEEAEAKKEEKHKIVKEEQEGGTPPKKKKKIKLEK